MISAPVYYDFPTQPVANLPSPGPDEEADLRDPAVEAGGLLHHVRLGVQGGLGLLTVDVPRVGQATRPRYHLRLVLTPSSLCSDPFFYPFLITFWPFLDSFLNPFFQRFDRP